MARIPAATVSAAAVELPAPSLAPPRSLTTTRAAAANARACARPIPLPAPVITTTR